MREIKKVNFNIEHLLSEKPLKHQEGRSGKSIFLRFKNMDLKFAKKSELESHI